MIKIINKTPKAKGFYELALSNQKEPVELHQDTLIKFNLFTANEFTESIYQEMLAYDQVARAMNIAISKLSYRNYTPKRMRDQLKMLNYNQDTIDEAIKQLKALNYINEEQTLSLMVEDFIMFDLKGKQALSIKLKQEGFPNELIDQTMALYTDELEIEKCQLLTEQLYKNLKKTSNNQNKLKLTQKLYQKGFTEETINFVITTFFNNLEDYDELAALEEAIDRSIKRYDVTKPKEVQKLIQKLMRDGFNYSDIKKYIK
ncbi:hypothetical protein [Liberiplasma polymorphum]|uniref:hypothetical protein n=1 Tax=Liberiplasma polymorphum TaxID=3374570 RepID=UPI0037740F6E